MLSVWRICAYKYRDTAFSGLGGLYVPGRWHEQGHRIVYTAQNLSLAALEVFVHLESDRVSLVAIQVNFPPSLSIEEVSVESLPANWQDTAFYPKLQQIGKEWLISRRSPILKVPSAIVPVENNYLLNPEHPDVTYIRDEPIEFVFDRRMWKKIDILLPALKSKDSGF